jgi:hypothetical protein
MNELALEQVLLRVLWFSPAPQLLHTRLSPPHEVCDSPDQAPHYHTLGPELGTLFLTRHLAGFEKNVVSFLKFHDEHFHVPHYVRYEVTKQS